MLAQQGEFSSRKAFAENIDLGVSKNLQGQKYASCPILLGASSQAVPARGIQLAIPRLTAPKQNPGPELLRERDGQFVQLAHDERNDDWQSDQLKGRSS
ncbi:hypothetical protein [Bradyrhizobium ivorense]|uniref:hypothetical protein n=1 Tax=Bradyrhizobium ivorense TaxID=2511166 RepID=UPI00155B338E|nr:hypothetical protein [Bradyrhizobium ivorense]